MSLEDWFWLALAIACLAIAALLLVNVVSEWRLRQALGERGITTAGTVVEVRQSWTAYGPGGSWSTIRYEDVTGRSHEITRYEYDRRQVGDSVPVRYDPDYPQRVLVAGEGKHLRPGVLVWILVGFGILSLLIALWE
jgi:hypothetical protein